MDAAVVLLLLSLVWSGVLTAYPYKWLRFQSKLYLELGDDKQWLEAADFCRGYTPQGHLANIASAAENSFVAALNGGAQMWIGASFSTSNEWIDWQGNEIGYSNWAMGQPSGVQADDGVYINSSPGQWTNYDPAWGYLAVCERDMTPNDATFAQLTSSSGTETATFTRHADRRLDCATFCIEQSDCSCIGYDSASKTCSGYKWKPPILPNVDHFCFTDIESTPPL